MLQCRLLADRKQHLTSESFFCIVVVLLRAHYLHNNIAVFEYKDGVKECKEQLSSLACSCVARKNYVAYVKKNPLRRCRFHLLYVAP